MASLFSVWQGNKAKCKEAHSKVLLEKKVIGNKGISKQAKKHLTNKN